MSRNFTSEAATINKAIAADATYGSFYRTIYTQIGASTTAPTSTNGNIAVQRFPLQISIPSVGSGVAGYMATNCSVITNEISILAIEYLLGTKAYNGAFTAGLSMPSKLVKGTNVQTASGLTMAVAETDLTSATNQTIDVEYTDQDGTTLQTASITFSNLVKSNSAFMLQKVLNVGSKGVRAITDISLTTTGSPTGTFKIYGLLPIWIGYTANATYDASFLQNLLLPWEIESGEHLAVYRFNTTDAGGAIVNLGLTPEPL